ncbi:hypothetical protein DPMN_135185 [Dreissena polymorpha]|uniref:Uncharacterized protein n=1 Tax=Dreissena polymorpha TaxID=45954 RepID=A0A9D4JGK0_DREPO|nr:hypothetical protein DPMN_135185 [Dreissena polymorpha]
MLDQPKKYASVFPEWLERKTAADCISAGTAANGTSQLFEHMLQEHIPRKSAPFYCALCGYKAMDAWSLASQDDRYAPHLAAVQRMAAVDNSSIMRVGTFTPGDFEKHVGAVVVASTTELPGWLTQMIDADASISATIAPRDPIQVAWDAACAGSREEHKAPAIIATRCEAVTP